jgi:hypothetical protein
MSLQEVDGAGRRLLAARRLSGARPSRRLPEHVVVGNPSLESSSFAPAAPEGATARAKTSHAAMSGDGPRSS